MECLHPKEIYSEVLMPSGLKEFRKVYVPCGTCDACLITKQIDSLSAQAAATRWSTLRSQSMFAEDLQSAINKNIIDEKTALKLDSELNYIRAKTRNMSADTILKYKDAVIRQWQIDYGLPLGLLNDYFNTAIGGAKLLK